MRMIRGIVVVALLSAYITYGLLLMDAISQSFKWYLFSFHLAMILITFALSVVGTLARSWFCLLALIAVAPLVYLQFFS
jgi:hypothetical protein